jgi:hypothetical protein
LTGSALEVDFRQITSRIHGHRYFKQIAMATHKSKTTARQQQISF